MSVKRVYPAIRPGIRMHVGLPGAGKTQTMLFEMQAMNIGGVPIIAFDRNGEIKEWPGKKVKLFGSRRPKVDGSAAFRKLKDLEPGTLYIVYDSLLNTQGNYKHAIRIADTYYDTLHKKYPNAKLVAGIAIPEAHLLLPKSGGDLEILEATTGWRHRKLALWFDGQRMAILNTTAVEVSRGPNAGALRIFPMGGHNDLKLIREMGGDELEVLMDEVNNLYEKGHKGAFIDCALTKKHWAVCKMYPMHMYEESSD